MLAVAGWLCGCLACMWLLRLGCLCGWLPTWLAVRWLAGCARGCLARWHGCLAGWLAVRLPVYSWLCGWVAMRLTSWVRLANNVAGLAATDVAGYVAG